MSSKHRRTSKSRAHASVEESRAAEATELQELAARHPDERQGLLSDAAGLWCEAGEYDRAVAVYQELLDTGCDDPHLIEAFRIGALWDGGHRDEARAAAALLRRQHPKDPGAWNSVAEMFEMSDEPRTATEWYTAGVTHLLGPATPLTLDAVEESASPWGVEMLLVGRHRVRRLLGEPHDDADDLADELHANRPGTFRGPVSLDDLHDPRRLRGADQDLEPEELRAERDRLSAEVAARKAALSRPQMTCALFWPPEEFAHLLDRWPALAADYGNEHDEHRHGVEALLRRMSGDGAPRLGVVHATVDDFATYVLEENVSPQDGEARAEYAADLAARGRAQAWPPPRNGPCWCGSARKYKKCCGNPGLT